MTQGTTGEAGSGREHPPATQSGSERRRDSRFGARCRAATQTIDPLHDPATGSSFYQTTDDDWVANVSRRGICIVSSQPPAIGTRLLVQIRIDGDERPVEVVGRACWTRVEFERGAHGARALCAVGIEVLGGSPQSLDRYDRSIAERSGSSVAAPEGLG